VTVEIFYMVVSVIAQLPEQRVAGGGRLGRLDFLESLGTSGQVMGDVARDIRCMWPRAMNSSLMW
jgi:alkylated DNA nucleotide flippase Atl1